MASLNDIETKVQNIIDKLSIKTITGTLPLTFTTHTAGAADNWVIYGNDEIYDGQQGVGERTRNLLEIVDLSGEHSNVEWVTDKSKGTYTLNGTANDNYLPWISGNITLKAGISYKLSGCVAGGSANTYMVYTYINNTYYRDLGNGVTIPAFNEDTECHISIAIYNGTFFENVVFKPMLREANTSDTFIPYGYQIPLTISQQGQTDKNYDIYIGDSPLTEGETVSKTSTGVDLELFEGENTITTTLYNKPVMKIKYKWR